MKKLTCVLAILLASVCVPATAATVSFLGTVQSGTAGPILGSFPRDFILTLDYTPNLGGGNAAAAGTWIFPASGSNSLVSVATSGGIQIKDNSVSGDTFKFNGNVALGLLNPTAQVNYTFTFTNPVDTISSETVTEENIEQLIVGQTMISFNSPTVFGVGSIRAAPEPSTMIALTGLIAGGCGIGYRRRMKAKTAEQTSDDENCVS